MISCVFFFSSAIEHEVLQKLENKDTLSQTVMHVMLHGNAGVGKTSLIKVLLGKEVDENEPSTEVLKEPIRISTISGTDSFRWSTMSLQDEAIPLLQRKGDSENLQIITQSQESDSNYQSPSDVESRQDDLFANQQ